MLTWTQSLEKVLYQPLENYSSLFSQQKSILKKNKTTNKHLHGLDGYQATNGLGCCTQADLSNTTGKGGLYFMPDGTQLSGISFFNVLAHY